MKPEFIAYGIYTYMLIGFCLWLWAMVDDAATWKSPFPGPRSLLNSDYGGIDRPSDPMLY